MENLKKKISRKTQYISMTFWHSIILFSFLFYVCVCFLLYCVLGIDNILNNMNKQILNIASRHEILIITTKLYIYIYIHIYCYILCMCLLSFYTLHMYIMYQSFIEQKFYIQCGAFSIYTYIHIYIYTMNNDQGIILHTIYKHICIVIAQL